MRNLNFILWVSFKKRNDLIRFEIHLIAALRAFATSPGGEGTFGDSRVDLPKAWLVRS